MNVSELAVLAVVQNVAWVSLVAPDPEVVGVRAFQLAPGAPAGLQTVPPKPCTAIETSRKSPVLAW